MGLASWARPTRKEAREGGSLGLSMALTAPAIPALCGWWLHWTAGRRQHGRVCNRQFQRYLRSNAECRRRSVCHPWRGSDAQAAPVSCCSRQARRCRGRRCRRGGSCGLRLGRILTTGSTGTGVLGQAMSPSGTGHALQGQAFGLGAGIRANSAHGRGAILSGQAAQLQLIPSNSPTHSVHRKRRRPIPRRVPTPLAVHRPQALETPRVTGRSRCAGSQVNDVVFRGRVDSECRSFGPRFPLIQPTPRLPRSSVGIPQFVPVVGETG